MEHIERTLRLPTQAPLPRGALQVIGAANDVLHRDENLRRDANATAFRDGVVTVRTRTGSAQAVIRRDGQQLVQKINTLLTSRYGGRSLVARISTRFTSEQ